MPSCELFRVFLPSRKIYRKFLSISPPDSSTLELEKSSDFRAILAPEYKTPLDFSAQNYEKRGVLDPGTYGTGK